MKSNVLWVGIACLALGVLIGRELPWPRGGGPGQAALPPVSQGANAIPAAWIKEGELGATEAFAGLTPAQRYTVLKVMNEKPCDCGCPHGSVAKCKKEDPACPRAPVILQTAVAMAKQGKSYDEVLAAVKKPEAPPPPPSVPQKAELASWTPVKGPKYAKVTIVEFSDFQWPFCSRVGPTLEQIEKTYGKDVRIAFRNQPLPFHEHAREAAEAAMAAHAQGKFWAMHDKLFQNQQKLDRASLDRYAGEIGLNMAKYKAAMDKHLYKDQIDADSKRGNEVGANGTPTLFINGQTVTGAQPFDSFKVVIDKELKHADELLQSGTALPKLYDTILASIKTPPAPPAGAAQAGGASEPAGPVKVEVGDAPTKGPKMAKVTILEFSDFQWPFCARVGPTLKQLEDQYKGKIRIAFKNEPLPFHNHAQLAAEAAMAAQEQGKFWQMHDKMFENQQKLDRADLEQYAQEVGLNMSKFRAALDSGKFKERVSKEAAEGQKVGAGGTPTFFVNGYKLVGAQPIDEFKRLIDRELAKK